MKNDLTFLHYILARLEQGGIPCIVFGGWATELTGAMSPRPHGDVDLLYFAEDFKKVDSFFKRETDIEEIIGKHFTHKRAFVCNDVVVELILISRKDNRLITNFWDEYEFRWPEINPVIIKNDSNVHEVEVCPFDVVNYYHRHEKQIAEVRARHAQNIDTLKIRCRIGADEDLEK